MKKILSITSILLTTVPAFAYQPSKSNIAYQQVKKNVVYQNQSVSDIRVYLGGNIAYSGVNYADKGEYAQDLKEFDSDYADFEINFGTKINKYFGFEAFALFSSPCELELKIFSNRYSSELSYTAFGANAMGYLPINENFNFIASIGVGQYQFTHEYNGVEDGINYSGTEESNKTGIGIGVGFSYDFTENFSMLGKYEYTTIDDKWFDTMSKIKIGIRYTF